MTFRLRTYAEARAKWGPFWCPQLLAGFGLGILVTDLLLWIFR